MSGFLTLTRNVPRLVTAPSYVAVYDQILTVVSGTPGANEIQAPVTAGTPVTLPGSQTFNSSELSIFLGGVRLEAVLDYSYVGSVPRTQVQFTFDLVVGDVLTFRIERAY